MFVQKIDNSDDHSTKLFIVTKSGRKYDFNYLFLDQETMKIKNYFTTSDVPELKFKNNENDLEPIFIVNQPPLIKEKVDEIFKSLNKNSQINFSYWYKKAFLQIILKIKLL